MILLLECKYHRLTPLPVPRPLVAVQGHPVPVVHHYPRVHVPALLAEDVRGEKIRPVTATYEVRRVNLEPLSYVRDDDVEGDGGVLQDRTQFLTPRNGEGNLRDTRGRVSAFSLYAREAGETAFALLALVGQFALCTFFAVVASFAPFTGLTDGSKGTTWTCAGIKSKSVLYYLITFSE